MFPKDSLSPHQTWLLLHHEQPKTGRSAARVQPSRIDDPSVIMNLYLQEAAAASRLLLFTPEQQTAFMLLAGSCAFLAAQAVQLIRAGVPPLGCGISMCHRC